MSMPRTRGVLRRMRDRALGDRLGRALKTADAVKGHAPKALLALRIAIAPRRRLLTWPGAPSRWQILTKICAWNGYELVQDPKAGYDVGIHFCESGACALPIDPPVINRRCADISKTRVADVFEQVFGYALSVDPTRHRGLMLSKSDRNCTHDGRILHGPLSREEVDPTRVYQRFIPSQDASHAIDWRTPIYGGRVPLVYKKRRPLAEGRFKDLLGAELLEPERAFSAEELALLARFAAAMGLDYGELDVLRDPGDGRIYVVDAANTPSGPPKALPEKDQGRAIATLAAAFETLVEETIAR